MEWVETTGRSIEEAKDRALDQLGVDEHDAEFEIMEEPRPGLFGRVRGEARVRARVRPTQPRPKADRRDRRRKPKDEAPAAGDGAPATKAAAPTAPAVDPPVEADVVGAEVGDAEDIEEAEETAAPARVPAAAAVGRDAGAKANGEAVTAARFLEGLAQAFGSSGTAEIVQGADDEVEVRLTGEDLGLLIGPRGQTLQAVQELARLAVAQREGERTGRFRIDIAGYRQRRREALAKFAAQVAEQVLASGQAKALEPMNAADRKVVHDTVNGIAGVHTTSEGEDPFRRVVLRPDA